MFVILSRFKRSLKLMMGVFEDYMIGCDLDVNIVQNHTITIIISEALPSRNSSLAGPIDYIHQPQPLQNNTSLTL